MAELLEFLAQASEVEQKEPGVPATVVWIAFARSPRRVGCEHLHLLVGHPQNFILIQRGEEVAECRFYLTPKPAVRYSPYR